MYIVTLLHLGFYAYKPIGINFIIFLTRVFILGTSKSSRWLSMSKAEQLLAIKTPGNERSCSESMREYEEKFMLESFTGVCENVDEDGYVEQILTFNGCMPSMLKLANNLESFDWFSNLSW